MVQTTSEVIQNNKILLVDDEINVCRGCQRIFEEEGYSMQTALSGREGLMKADNEDFDAVIVDMKMPDINGMDVIKTLKEKQPEMPIIMITGYASVPTAIEAMKLGADDYIPKPFKPNEIIDAVKNALQKVKNTRERVISRIKEMKGEVGDSALSVEEDLVIDKEQVLEVLNRASIDKSFGIDLLNNGSEALIEYNMSSKAKAAIVSGDINWLEKNIGKLTDEQMEYLMRRLSMEKW